MGKSLGMVAACIGCALIGAGIAHADGAAVYAKCKGCHGATGAGNAAMKVEPFKHLSDADMTKIIKEGKGKMPGYAGKISDGEVADVIKHIKTLK